MSENTFSIVFKIPNNYILVFLRFRVIAFNQTRTQSLCSLYYDSDGALKGTGKGLYKNQRICGFLMYASR